MQALEFYEALDGMSGDEKPERLWGHIAECYLAAGDLSAAAASYRKVWDGESFHVLLWDCKHAGIAWSVCLFLVCSVGSWLQKLSHSSKGTSERRSVLTGLCCHIGHDVTCSSHCKISRTSV